MTYGTTLRTALYTLIVLSLVVVVGLLGSKAASAASPECDHVIEPSMVVADGEGNYAHVAAGDTVCIAAGLRGHLVLKNFQGEHEAPITFINDGGRVEIETDEYNGIEITNSRFIRLTGTGSDDTYGFRVANADTAGVVIRERSSEYEIDHIEIHDIRLIGILAKTNETCPRGSDKSTSINRKTFEQRNSVFHDNYIHDVGTEGLYIGSSYYFHGKTLDCPVGQRNILPPRLIGVQVYNNVVERTGWDGIQVGSAMRECYIHHNTVRHDSLKDVVVQAASIIVNHGSTCDVYNNLIWEGNGAGIKVIGRPRGPHGLVYNNVIVRPGRGEMTGDNPGTGIIASTGRVNIWNNTIIEPKTIGIKYRNSATSATFRIANNIIVAPGNGEEGYIEFGTLDNAKVSNNLLLATLDEARFHNASTGDFSLMADSPAIDAGEDLRNRGVTIDHRGSLRPHGEKFDIGAFEYEGISKVAQ